MALYWGTRTTAKLAPHTRAVSFGQVALLVAGINYVLEVETTLLRVDGGDSTALAGYHDLQASITEHSNMRTWLRTQLRRYVTMVLTRAQNLGLWPMGVGLCCG